MDSFDIERYSEKLEKYKKLHSKLGCAYRQLNQALEMFKSVAYQSVDPQEDSFIVFSNTEFCKNLEEAKVTVDACQHLIKATAANYALAVRSN